MKRTLLAAALLAASCGAQAAASSIGLGGYSVAGIYDLDILNGTSGGISGLEASAVAYAKDRIDPNTGKLGTLFFVGDEGTGVIEISTTGQTLGYMSFDWTGTGSTNNDTEGLTYLGNGKLVVGEERLQDAYSFQYVAGGTATLADSFVSISNVVVKNSGMEGISYDPRDGSFVSIKQETPEDILAGTLTFAPATGGLPATLTPKNGNSPTGGGVSTMSNLFDPNLLGLATLSDVQTLSPVSALSGTAAADNLLILSLGSRILVETDRSGNILSSFDLSGLLNSGDDFNAIEGVTVDDKGTIYLVAEQLQGSAASASATSKLIVLTAPVPEPETYAMMLGGLGLLGFAARRRKAG